MSQARLVARGFDPSDLQADIAALQVAVNGIDIDLSDMNAAILALQSTVSGLSGLNTRVNTLESMPQIWSTRTDNFSSVPIGTGSQNRWRSLHHIDVTDVPINSVWFVLVQGQLRSEWNFNIECMSRIGWSSPVEALDRPSGPILNGMSNFYLVGSNRSQTREHYFDWQKSGIHKFDTAYSTVRFHNDCRFRSSDPAIDGSGNQAMLNGVEQGGMVVMRLK